MGDGSEAYGVSLCKGCDWLAEIQQAPRLALLSLVVAAAVSLIVLWVYRLRVLRSLRARDESAPDTLPPGEGASTGSQRAGPPVSWSTLVSDAVTHRKALTRLYVLGGLALCVALAFVDAVANSGMSRPSAWRLAFAAVACSLPLPITIRLLQGRWKPALVVAGVQYVALAVLGRFWPHLPDDSMEQAFGTALLLAALMHPRVRAMGILAAAFFTVVFVGAFTSVLVALQFMQADIEANILADPRTTALVDQLSQRVTDPLRLAALGPDLQTYATDHAVFVLRRIALLALVGTAVSLVLGGLLFARVAAAYRRKRVSDQWLLVGSVWLFFAFAVASVHSPIGVVGNILAVGVFTLVVRIGWSRIPCHSGRCVRLLLLRSFLLGERSNRLFQQLETLWRCVGSVQLVGSVDLALTTLEPHELLDFLRGRGSREFVHSAAAVDQRLATFDHDRDPDGRYRVNVLFCRGDATWKHAVGRLLRESDCVLMDLRGFSRHRAGCVFEVRSLAELSQPRVVFLVDAVTDLDFVRETWSSGRAPGHAGSAGAEGLRFVSEEPAETVSERIMVAFSSESEAPDDGATMSAPVLEGPAA